MTLPRLIVEAYDPEGLVTGIDDADLSDFESFRKGCERAEADGSLGDTLLLFIARELSTLPVGEMAGALRTAIEQLEAVQDAVESYEDRNA